MIIEANNQRYALHFYHEPQPSPKAVQRLRDARLQYMAVYRLATKDVRREMQSVLRSQYILRRTTATLHVGAPCPSKTRPCTEPVIATGVAKCSVLDVFNPKIGREISLGKALKQLKLSREMTRALFRNYRTRIEQIATRHRQLQSINYKPRL